MPFFPPNLSNASFFRNCLESNYSKSTYATKYAIATKILPSILCYKVTQGAENLR